MALDHNDFLRLNRIAESLRRSDPELARQLAAPLQPRTLWTVLSYVTLSVFALLTLAGLVIGDATTPSSTIAKSAFQRNAVDARTDDHTPGRLAPPMLSPANYGAVGTP